MLQGLEGQAAYRNNLQFATSIWHSCTVLPLEIYPITRPGGMREAIRPPPQVEGVLDAFFQILGPLLNPPQSGCAFRPSAPKLPVTANFRDAQNV